MNDKSDRILAEIKSRRQSRTVDVEAGKVKLAIFSLNGSHFAFNGNDTKEILPYEEISFVPGSPDFILGIINVRGDIESVINIHKLMNLPDLEVNHKSRIIIATKEGIRSGILVDSVEDVIDFPENEIKPAILTLDKATKELVTGEISYNNRNVTLLDVGKLFNRLVDITQI